MVEAQINHSHIEEYAKKVAGSLVEKHFTDKDVINGQEILHLSEVKQINFFVLKNLFEKWQEETRNLRSPFFNYKSEKVTKALVTFMNVLSQNIEIGKEDFEPLLTTAIQDTLYVTLTPFDHFWADLSQGPDSHTIKNLKAKGKYIKQNKHIYEALMEGVIQVTDDKISKQNALTILEGVIADGNHEPESNELIVSQLSELQPFDMQFIYQEESPEPEVEPEQSDEDLLNDLFDDETLVQEPEAETAPIESSEPESDKPSTINDEPAEDETETVIDEPEEETPTAEEEVIQEEVLEKEEDAKDQIETIPPAASEDQPQPSGPKKLTRKPIVEASADENVVSDSQNQLNQKYNQETQTLNDQLKDDGKVTIADIHETQSSGKMQESISVNQRYMFINELFQGNADQYAQAINDIERCESFDDSVELMIQKYAKKLDWNMNSQEVKELLKVIFKRYR